MTLQDKTLQSLTTWAQGINNVAPITDLPDGALREALNVDLTDSGKPRRRKGFTSIYSGSNIRSLKTSGGVTVFAEGGDLKSLGPDNSTDSLLSGLDPDNYLAYAEVNRYLYFSDGHDVSGKIKTAISGQPVVEEWPIAFPDTKPQVAALTYGGLDEGRYLVAYTNVGSNGEESGALPSVAVDVPAGGGIAVTDLPTTHRNNLYATKANGERFYYVVQLSAATSSFNVSGSLRAKELTTMHLEPLPTGSIMFHAFGRMWVAVGNLLHYSEPFNFGSYNPAAHFFYFAEDISIALPVENGIYVCAGSTYFLGGMNPKEMTQDTVYPHDGVPGTGMSVSPKVFNMEGKEDVAYWFSDKGPVIGMPDGQVQPLTEDRLAVPEYEVGATMYRAEDGIQQMVSAVKNRGRESTLGTSDSASAIVIRNGVVIP